MIFTNGDAYKLFLDYTSQLPRNASKAQKCDLAAKSFIERKVPAADQKLLCTKIQRLLVSRPGNKLSEENFNEWKKVVFFDFDVPAPLDEKPKQRGRPSMTLGDHPCLKKQRLVMKEMVDTIEQFAEEQRMEKENVLQMIVYECHRKWHTSVKPSTRKIPIPDATALLYNVNLSLNQYQMVRTLCLPHGVEFPPRNDVDEYKHSLHPEITSCQLKSSVSVKSLLNETASSLV